MAERRRIAYLFPGQGAQYIGMGKDVYETYPKAREIYDRGCDVIGFDIKKVCFDGPADHITQTRFAQPAIFVTSIACLEAARSRLEDQYEVVAAAGLSLGEATALVSADVLTVDDGMRFVKDRGFFMDEASIERPGTMAAIMGLALGVVENICSQTGAEVGNLNSPGQIVISGLTQPVLKAMELCKAQGAKRCIRLEVSGAFHSSCMNSACKKIEGALSGMRLQPPKFSVVSNLTAKPEDDPDSIKKNLVRQMNHRTLWEASMREIIRMGVKHFYEIGPGKVLKGLMRRIDPSITVFSVGTVEDFRLLEKECGKTS